MWFAVLSVSVDEDERFGNEVEYPGLYFGNS